jgi:6-phosphofructokinase
MTAHTGGTFLETTNKHNPFRYPQADGSFRDCSAEIIKGYQRAGLNGLISIGGDGSLKIIGRLAKQGNWNLIAIPKTIDNDLSGTDMAIGHATAVDVVVEAMDRLRMTAASHRRIMVLEVMGRDAGHIALNAGLSGGADAILIPEVPYSIHALRQSLEKVLVRRPYALVVVSESVRLENGQDSMVSYGQGQRRYRGIGYAIGDAIEQETGVETRVTVLGHLQRGERPSSMDRLLAIQLGVHAVDLIVEGRKDRLVVQKGSHVTDVPISSGRTNPVSSDNRILRTAEKMGIYMG